MGAAHRYLYTFFARSIYSILITRVNMSRDAEAGIICQHAI